MKRCIAIFSALILMSTFVSAQQVKRYLVSIDLFAVSDKNVLESLRLPAYHLMGSRLIAGITEEQAVKLRNEKIGYTILEVSPQDAHYYLFSKRKNASPAAPAPSARQLAAEGREILVRAETGTDFEVDWENYSLIELKPSSFLFRNEKFVLPVSAAADVDSVIKAVIARVHQDSVRFFVQSLQNFGTRYCMAPNRDSVSLWIQRQFFQMGCADVKLDSFLYQNTWQKNVVATVRGSAYPDQCIVIGGHHDSYSGGTSATNAPGADDNASGTAAVMEIARVMMRSGYTPKSSIRFITFAAEELGLLGSRAYAQKARTDGMDVQMMINHDMIAQTFSSLSGSKVNLNYYTGHEFLREMAYTLTGKYTVLAPVRGGANSAGSDSYEFWSRGYPSVYFEEYDFSPYYHSPQDLTVNCKFDYCAEVIRASCALAVTVSGMPATVRDLAVRDLGDGHTVRIQWKKSNSQNTIGYKVYIGKSSSVYDTIYTTPDTSMTLRNLTDGTRCYIGVASFDKDGIVGFIVERTVIPMLKPVAPANFAVEPQWKKILLRWSGNREYDLLGYNVYRAAPAGAAPVKISLPVTKDTTFTDTAATSGIVYYYSISAVDSAMNESPLTSTLRGRAVTLDRGILIVDETAGGDGSPMLPTKTEVGDFYQSILAPFSPQRFNADSAGGATLTDIGPYSTVVWHGNDPGDYAAAARSKTDLMRYLQWGGKVLMTEYRPSTAFSGINSYPHTFTPGEFIYDWMKVAKVELKLFTKFYGAVPPIGAGLPLLTVDTNKTLAGPRYHLSGIESISPVPGANAIYLYQTLYDTTQNEGKMKGMPVGIEYSGRDYQLVLLSFPLYYIQKEGAQYFVQQVIHSRFGEPMSAYRTMQQTPADFSLSQNYPNPFNPLTNIEFRLPIEARVKLSVFDLLGREVAVLVNEKKSAGIHTIAWDAGAVSSGIYFYRLEAGKFTGTKKLFLIK